MLAACAAAVIAASVGLTACGRTDANRAVVVNGRRADCARNAQAGLRALLAAMSHGQVHRADSLVAQQSFSGFVVGVLENGRPPRVPANRPVDLRWKLRAYLRARVAQHDRLRVRSAQFVASGPDDQAGLSAVITRRADDIARGRPTTMNAKVGWDCRRNIVTGLVGHSEVTG